MVGGRGSTEVKETYILVLDVPVWSKLESGHLPSMQQLVQILDNEMKMNVHMNGRPHHHS